MKVRNRTTLHFAPMFGKVNWPSPSVSLCVRGTFAFQPGAAATLKDPQPPIEGDTLTPTGACIYDADLALYKPRADLMFVGTCYTPGGKAVPTCPAKFSIGQFSKELAVIGNRKWDKGLIFSKQGQIEPFTQCAMNWGNAFGGEGFAENPSGKGFKDGVLPNIELPGKLVKSNGDRPHPAGFGPVHRTWKPRTNKLGTYDKAWMKERMPYFPKDFDWSYFNAAPEDQQIEGFLRGDENVALENLHPNQPRVETKLPGIRVRAFVRLIDEKGAMTLLEVPMNLDTLFVKGDKEEIVLVWRGVQNIRNDEGDDIADFLVFSEPLGKATSSAEIESFFAEPPEEVEGIPTEPAGDFAPIEEANALVEALTKLKDAKLAEIAGRLKGKVPHASHAALLAAPAVFMGFGPAIASLKGARAQMLATGRSPDAALDKSIHELEHDPAMKDAETDLLIAQAMAMLPLAKKMTKVDLAKSIRAGEKGKHEDFSGADLSEEDFAGKDFTNAVFRNADLHGTNFTGCILVGCVFESANLADAKLGGSKAATADFAQANLQGADLAKGDFKEATFSSANLQKAQAKGADFTGANFGDANCSGMVAEAAVCKEADFQRSKLDGAVFDKADLSGANLGNCKGLKASFKGAKCVNLRAGNCNLDDSVFEDAIAPESVFEGSSLRGASFRFADLGRALFPAANLEKAVFFGAVVRRGMLRKANLKGAQAGNADFFQASFEKADLSGASLITSNCFEANFWDAITDGTDLNQANVKRTRLAK